MKKLTPFSLMSIMALCMALLMWNCSGEQKSTSTEAETTTESEAAAEPAEEAAEPTGDESLLANKGIGPVTDLYLGPIDNAMAEEGKAQFELLCTTCHKPTENFIGPAPKDILKRRSPEWVMNMILNPEEMLEKDPIGQQILKEANGVPMVGQGVTEENARKLLEYFRTL